MSGNPMVVNNSEEAMAPSEFKRRERRRSRKRSQEKIIKNLPCPDCRDKGGDSTGNHLMVFESGSGYCNRCPKSFTKEQVEQAENGKRGTRRYQRKYNGYQNNYKPELTTEDLQYFGMIGCKSRGIPASADKHFGIRTEINESNGTPIARYYPYYSGDDLYGYKNRKLPKDWGKAIGTIKGTDLFGWHLCQGPRRTLVITEGEEDCAAGYAMWKAMNQRSESRRVRRSTPHIVSLPDGTKGAKKVLMKHLPELMKYQKIIWMGDNHKIDEEGAKALEVAVQVLGVKKLYVAEYADHKKDLCDVLDKDNWEDSVNEFSDMWWNAEQYRPVDIIEGSQYTYEQVFAEPVIGYDFPFKSICDKIGGMRLREHTVWMAGSGVKCKRPCVVTCK